MDYQLPYYMAYPMPLQYDDEKIEQRDFEYMKSMYPETAKRILPYVEDECDRMAYEGSVVYDEYPDQLQIRLMCNRIFDRVKGIWGAGMEEEMEAEQMESQQIPGAGRRRSEDRLRDLVQVLLFQELFRRRCEHRNCRRRFY